MRILLLVFCCVLLPGLALAQSADQPTQTAPTIETSTEAPSDEDINQRILEIFAEIEGLEATSARVNSGVVVLRGAVNDAAAAEQAEHLASRVDGVVSVRNEIEVTVAVRERIGPVVDRFTQRFWQAVNYLPLLTVALIIFALIAAAGLWVAGRDWPWSRITPNAFIADLLRQIVRLSFIAVALVVALDVLGATAALGTIAGAAGIAGLAVGFAVRDTVENYIASILLSLRQPFLPNDHILIDGHEGRVVRLTSRATIMLSLDGNQIRIPNSSVFKGVITNFTRNPERRFDFQLGIDAGSDPKQAISLGVDRLKSFDFVLDQPAPDGWIRHVGESNIVVCYSGWVDQTKADFYRARSEAIRLTKSALESNGISLPEPIYRLRVDRSAPDPFGAPAPLRPRRAAPPDTTIDERPGDTKPLHTIEGMVESERSKLQEPDLLEKGAEADLE